MLNMWEHCVQISFKGKPYRLGFGEWLLYVKAYVSETLSSNKDNIFLWWYSSENYSHRSQKMVKIRKKTHRHGYIMDAIYAISTSSRPIVVRIDILKVENSSSKTLAYRALTDAATDAAAAAGYWNSKTETIAKA